MCVFSLLISLYWPNVDETVNDTNWSFVFGIMLVKYILRKHGVNYSSLINVIFHLSSMWKQPKPSSGGCLGLRSRVTSLDVHREFKTELHLLSVEKKQMRWFVMSPGCIPIEVFQACSPGKKTWGQSKNKLEGLYIYSVARACLGISQEETKEQGWREGYLWYFFPGEK